MRRLFAVRQFHPPHEAVRRNEPKHRLGVAVSCLVAIRHNPDAAVRLDQGDDESRLFFRAVAHRAHHLRQVVLIQPPDARESLDDNQVVHRLFEPVAVVEKQRLAEFKDFPVTLTFPREAVARVIFGDCGIIHDAPSVTNEFAVRIMECPILAAHGGTKARAG